MPYLHKDPPMGQRLLLVDSDRRFVKDHQVALESAFDVEFLYASEGVLPRLESGEFAAVLICVEVSENKGYALCSTIRKNPKLTDLKIALISSKATEEEYARHQSLKGKADLYLHKPMISGSLVAALSSLVPPRAIDPDNPLGDLSGADLGDEWLESLKTELETEDKHISALPDPAPSIPAPQPPPAPRIPSMATVAIQIPTVLQTPVVSPDAGKVALLEARVKDLEYKLQTSAERVDQKNQELEQLKAEHAVATRNLDELDLQREAVELLQEQLREAEEKAKAYETSFNQGEEAQAGLKFRLEEVEGEHHRLRDAADDLIRQINDKEQAIGILQESKQGLEQRLEELQAAEGQLGDVRAEVERLRATEQERDQLAQRTRELEDQLGGLHNELENTRAELGRQAEGQNQRAQELEGRCQWLEGELRAGEERLQGTEKYREELAQRVEALQSELNDRVRELEAQAGSTSGVQEQLATVQEELTRRNGECQGLQALLEGRNSELAEKTRELETARVDVAGLEATLRAQRRELAEQEDRMRAQVRETESIRENIQGLEARAAELQNLNSELEARSKELEFRGSEQEAWIAELETRNQGQETILTERLQEISHLRASAEELRSGMASIEDRHAQELDELRGRMDALEQERQQQNAQFEVQKLELLSGLDEKEALVGRLNANLEAQRERLESLEREKRELEGHVNERAARLEALTGAIADLENGIRRASDLTRPF